MSDRKRLKRLEAAVERQHREFPGDAHTLCATCKNWAPHIQGVFSSQCESCKRSLNERGNKFLEKHQKR